MNCEPEDQDNRTCRYCGKRYPVAIEFYEYSPLPCSGPRPVAVSAREVYNLDFGAVMAKVPEGWLYEDFRIPNCGEFFLSDGQDVMQYPVMYGCRPGGPRIILKRREPDPPKPKVRIIFEEDPQGDYAEVPSDGGLFRDLERNAVSRRFVRRVETVP